MRKVLLSSTGGRCLTNDRPTTLTGNARATKTRSPSNHEDSCVEDLEKRVETAHAPTQMFLTQF